MSQTSLTAPAQLFPADVFTSSSTQQYDLGTVGQTSDGRRFRYVKAGGTSLVVGKLQQSPAEDTSNAENLSIGTSAIGATTVTTTTTVTLTANQCAGGYMVVTTGTGAGYTYKIKSHPAATAAVVTFTLEDPIIIATASGSSKIDVHFNLYNGVILNPSTASSAPIGVAVYAITNAQFGWIQTGGPCGVLADGTITVGNTVVASNGTNGAVENATNASTEGQAVVGLALTGITTAEYGTVDLLLD